MKNHLKLTVILTIFLTFCLMHGYASDLLQSQNTVIAEENRIVITMEEYCFEFFLEELQQLENQIQDTQGIPEEQILGQLIFAAEKRLESSPEDNNLMTRLATLYHRAGAYEKAIELSKKVVIANKNNFNAVYVFTDSCRKLNNHLDAVDLLESLSGQSKNYKLALLLSSIYEDMGEHKNALFTMEQLVQNFPDMKAYYWKIAQLRNICNETAIRIYVNGKPVDFSQYDYVEPAIKGNRTLIPVRATCETLDAEVKWDPRNSVASIIHDGMTIELTKNDKFAKVNEKEILLDVPASIVNNRMMLPLRFISENLDKKIDWYSFSSGGKVISIQEIKQNTTEETTNSAAE